MIKNIHKHLFPFLITLAFIIRLVLMPISGHSDLLVINMFPELLQKEQVIDILTYTKEEVRRENFSYYPPLVYYTIGLFQFSYRYFSDTFSPWMTNLRGEYESGLIGQAPDFIKRSPNPMIFRDIFLAKMPYLLFEISSICILLVFIKRNELNKKILILWLFNPVLIYGAYIFGQFDIIPTFFILLGLAILNKNPGFGILSIGIAAAFKNYSFLFIIPLAIIYGDSFVGRIKLIIVGFLPTFIFVIPTLINSPDQAIYAVVNKILVNSKKPLVGWAFYSQILRYLVLTCSYLFVILLSLSKVSKWQLTKGLCLVSILLLLTLVPRTSFHYLFWAFPFTILWFKNVKVAAIILLIQTVSFASYKLLAPQLQAGLFAPINPDYFYSLPTFNGLINTTFPYRIVSTAGFFIFLILNLSLIALVIYEITFKSEVSLQKLGRK